MPLGLALAPIGDVPWRIEGEAMAMAAHDSNGKARAGLAGAVMIQFLETARKIMYSFLCRREVASG